MFGHPTLSRPVSRLLARDDIELVVVAHAAEWLDPGRRAHDVVDAVDLEPGDGDWLVRWSERRPGGAGRTRRPAGARCPTSPVPRWPPVSGRRCAAGDTLVVGSSSPIRDLDLAPVSASPPTVFANRGLSGIDGTVSTAVGVAAVTERPSACPARGRDLPARPDRADHRPVRAAAGPADRRGERQRRQHLRHPRARAAGAPGCLRADLRHPPRRRGRRGGDGAGGHRSTGHECRRALRECARRARRGVSR